ncbi:SpdD-like protein [Streptomyces sp. HNM0663]|uniref:SpdD-like protein n=1 Tax=Streptomyces chengmaiensis TaxID=3040919 RepID=A0ABT6HM17_9ACTN|nr:SpdD-like protein [Streptomyces chengmaiensis]MDH2389738.1 SpdD-like protein [Streptomyces chengmaiensis]
MLRPKIPANPLPTGIVPRIVEPTAVEQHSSPLPAPCACQQHTPAAAPPAPASGPTLRLTPTGLLIVVGGAAAVVLVVGAVLVSLLLAVAITAVSVAVCADAVRSTVNGPRRR